MKMPLELSLAIACLALPAAWADEARIPIFQQTNITAPGHYILTRDLGVASGDTIQIGSNNVTLDLNGHTIQIPAGAAGINIVGGFRGILIRNGHLLGGNIGIFGTASPSIPPIDVRIENVEIRGASSGIGISNAGTVEVISCRVADASYAGIQINGPTGISFGGRIVDTVVDNISGTAIALQTPRGMEIRRNLITRFGTGVTGAYGLVIGGSVVDSGGNIIEDNVIRGSDTDTGIIVSNGPNNLIANNVISALGGWGVVVSTNGNRIVGNVISFCVRGLSLETGADRNIVERNHFESNKEDGISVSGSYNLIDSNVSEGNAFYGLEFKPGASSNAYRANMLRNNLGGVNGSATDAGGNIL
jgi:parallel beta-helix repeat protein